VRLNQKNPMCQKVIHDSNFRISKFGFWIFLERISDTELENSPEQVFEIPIIEIVILRFLVHRFR